MFRFVALVWDHRNPHAAAAARLYKQRLRAASSDWRSTSEDSGFVLLQAEVLPGTWNVYPLENGAGAVLGKIFSQKYDEKSGFSIVNTLTNSTSVGKSESDKIVDSKGRHLIDHYWGRYVAIIRDTATSMTWILRDPQGGLPCYLLDYFGVKVIFSSLEDCVPEGLMRFSINWDWITARVCNARRFSYTTALNEISEVVQGECLTINSNGATQRTLYWDPVRIASTDVITDPDEASRQLRLFTRMCVWAWAGCYKRVLHNLSGGFDSSVVLSCLSSAPSQPTVICTNYFNTSYAGDERHFARLAAEKAGCELIELKEGSLIAPFESLRHIKKTPVPSSYHRALTRAPSYRQFVQQWNLEASFDGTMGDQLYGAIESRLIGIDHLLHRGFSRQTLGVLTVVAALEGASAWSILADSIRARVRPDSWRMPRRVEDGRRLVRPQALEDIGRTYASEHPWLLNAHGLSPGKRNHIESLALSFIPDDTTGLRGPCPPLSPLFSQPLVETSLRIPMFVLSANAVPRAAARRAFAQDIPPAITERTSKGMVDGAMQVLTESNRHFLREFMLEGTDTLVARGLLDRKKVEDVLADDNGLFSIGAAELICLHLDTQAWLKAIAALTQPHGAYRPSLVATD